jgi:DNA-binding CsgD family transcriptional regulator
LRGLFDLSPAEAGIAAGLAAGLTVTQIAAARGIGLTTARTHLAQIFRKTGTAQQGQLVALLKGAVGPVD